MMADAQNQSPKGRTKIGIRMLLGFDLPQMIYYTSDIINDEQSINSAEDYANMYNNRLHKNCVE